MPGQAGDDHPDVGSVVDLVPASRGGSFLSWMEAVGDDEFVVAAPTDAAMRPVEVAEGERVDLVWRGPAQLHSLPCELVAVAPAEQPRWLLRRAGVVQRGQRRGAVRAPLSVPVSLGPESARATGTTIDLSEGGLRCVLDAGSAADRLVAGSPPGQEAGTVTQLSLRLPDLAVSCLAEITRRFPRDDARVELSVRFIGLSEHVQDEVRRRVFHRLRELRQRGLL